MSTNEEIKLNLFPQVDRRLFPPTGGTLYLLVKVSAPMVEHNTERPPLNLGFVIDRSGSMSGRKLDYVKKAAHYAVGLLDDRDRAALVMFDDEVDVISGSQRMTAENKETLRRAILPIETGGRTNMAGGWLTGCDQVADHQQAEAMNRSLLLTDGLANVGMTDLEVLARHAKELRLRGVTTSTFGVGEDFDEHMLRALADAGGGHFYFIEDPKGIPEVFRAELKEMLYVVAQDTWFTLSFPNGVRAALLNESYETQIAAATCRVYLGALASGETREFVFQIDAPEATLGTVLVLETGLHYKNTTAKAAMDTQGETIRLTCVSQQQYDGELPDTQVQRAAQAHIIADSRLKAMRALHFGRADEAQQYALDSAFVLRQRLSRLEDSEQAANAQEQYVAHYQRSSVQIRKQELNENYKVNRSRK